jgi:hypothetical protein
MKCKIFTDLSCQTEFVNQKLSLKQTPGPEANSIKHLRDEIHSVLQRTFRKQEGQLPNLLYEVSTTLTSEVKDVTKQSCEPLPCTNRGTKILKLSGTQIQQRRKTNMRVTTKLRLAQELKLGLIFKNQSTYMQTKKNRPGKAVLEMLSGKGLTTKGVTQVPGRRIRRHTWCNHEHMGDAAHPRSSQKSH